MWRVSVRTVREAIIALEAKGVVRQRHGAGTFVCERRGGQYVGLVFGFNWRFARSMTYRSARVLARTQDCLRRQGMLARMYWFNFYGDEGEPAATEHELWTDLRDGRIAAMVVTQGVANDLAVHERLATCGVPVVWPTLDRQFGPYGVGVDWAALIREGVRMLAESGGRRLALLYWNHGRAVGQENSWCRIFRETLAARGLPIHGDWLRGDAYPVREGAGYQQFRELWTARQEKPDGLLVLDDFFLPDAVTAIRELGIDVPERLRVVATANKGAVLCPYLPAMRLLIDPDALAEAMATMALQLAMGEEPPAAGVVVPFQCVRNTELPLAQPGEDDAVTDVTADKQTPPVDLARTAATEE